MFVESVSKVFPDEISRLFLPYTSYESETLHVSSLGLIKIYAPYANLYTHRTYREGIIAKFRREKLLKRARHTNQLSSSPPVSC